MVPANSPGPVPQGQKIAIEIPHQLQAVYANVAFITHTMAEVVLDFAQILPRMPKGTVNTRIVMSPLHAKQLQQALAQSIASYEQQFGEIKLPKVPHIADYLFPPPGAGETNTPPEK
ncbi:MAG: DUF3467 domain-containing protein [Chloroflexi bacterium]|nr:DUF3467 domain-containing protein [Chloroflexota bacterium]MBP8056818.1 DUF3467 domain-containing protein [Chloroflexota bacterium]